jgi:hypothetical protein
MQPLTPAEVLLMQDQADQNGGFYKALMFAIKVADTENRAKLAMGFPDLVTTVRRFQNEPGYYEDLCIRWESDKVNY